MSQENTSLQTRAADELANAEGTRPGYVVSPAVDIFETPQAITVLADLPGVKPDALRVDLDDGVLTLSGSVELAEEEDEGCVLREYRPGHYRRQFSLSETIDQERIEAKLTDGVLRLTLPKVDKARARKIQVTTH